MSGDILEQLAGQPFFQGMAQDHLQLLAGCAGLREFEADRLLLRQGEEADGIYLLLEGRVALELVVPGREPLVLETLGPGELVGASWVMPPHQAHFDVRSRSPVRALRIDVAALREAMEGDAALGYAFCSRFLKVVTRRLQATRMQLMDLYGHPELFSPPRVGSDPEKHR